MAYDIGFGGYIAYQSGSGFTHLVGVQMVTGPDLEGANASVGHNASSGRIIGKTPGMTEVGPFKVRLLYDPTQYATLVGLYQDKITWQVGDNGQSHNWEGEAYLSKLGAPSFEATNNDLPTHEIEVQPTGSPDYGT